MPLFSGTDLVLYFFFYGFLAWLIGSACNYDDFPDYPVLRKKCQYSGLTVYDLSLWYFYRQHIFIFST